MGYYFAGHKRGISMKLSRRRFVGLAVAALALPDMSLAGGFPKALIGRWHAESIRRRGVAKEAHAVIVIAADGRVTGSGGCNRISGGMTVNGAYISFSSMISTKMACLPAIMKQESEFLSALGDARLWRIDEQRDRLILVDGHGVTVLRLLRM